MIVRHKYKSIRLPHLFTYLMYDQTVASNALGVVCSDSGTAPFCFSFCWGAVDLLYHHLYICWFLAFRNSNLPSRKVLKSWEANMNFLLENWGMLKEDFIIKKSSLALQKNTLIPAKLNIPKDIHATSTPKEIEQQRKLINYNMDKLSPSCQSSKVVENK